MSKACCHADSSTSQMSLLTNKPLNRNYFLYDSAPRTATEEHCWCEIQHRGQRPAPAAHQWKQGLNRKECMKNTPGVDLKTAEWNWHVITPGLELVFSVTLWFLCAALPPCLGMVLSPCSVCFLPALHTHREMHSNCDNNTYRNITGVNNKNSEDSIMPKLL